MVNGQSLAIKGVLNNIFSFVPNWLASAIVAELAFRLDFIKYDFKSPLIIGDIDGEIFSSLNLSFLNQNTFSPACGQNDARAGYARAGHDIIIGILDPRVDVKTQITDCAAKLLPGGMLMLACLGNGTLESLRIALIEAEIFVHGRASSLLPQWPSAGHVNNLVHALGLTPAVVDSDIFSYEYPSLARAMRSIIPLDILLTISAKIKSHLALAAARDRNLRTAQANILFMHGWKK